MINDTHHKNEKGITLIILAVTIVVILILAAITVDVSFSDNGIIKTALGLQNNINSRINREEQRLNQLQAELANGTYEGGSGLVPDSNIIGGGETGGDDTTLPSAPKVEVIGNQGEPGYYNSEVQVKVTANDRANSLTYTVEGTGIEQGSVSTETSIGNGQSIYVNQDGAYMITAYEYNRYGKKSEGTIVAVIRDTVAPTATLQVNSANEESITVQFISTDPEPSSGLARSYPYTFYYKEKGATEWVEAGKGSASSYTYEGLPPNTTYTLKAEVTDKAGNVGISNEVENVQTEGSVEISRTTDWTDTHIKQNEETSFTITLTKPAKVSDTPEVTLEPNNTGSTVRIEAVNPDENGYSTEFKVTLTGGNGNGQESVTVGEGTLVDEKGNTVPSINKGGVTVDNTKPTMEMQYPEEGTIIRKNEHIDIILTPSEEVTIDETKITIRGEQETGSTTIITVSPEGIITITITGGDGTGDIQVTIEEGFLTDKAGNTNDAVSSFNYKVDNTAPIINRYQVTGTTTNTITVEVDAEDVGGAGLATKDTYTYYISIDPTFPKGNTTTVVTTIDDTYTFENLQSEQTYYTKVEVKDEKGNTATSDTINAVTGTVPGGQGSIGVSDVTWEIGNPEQEGTAEITLTNNKTDFSMQYQITTIDSQPAEANWIEAQENPIKIDGLHHEDQVHARLKDNNGNTGDYATISILDEENPTAGTLTLETGTSYTSGAWTQYNVCVNAGSDAQSGVKTENVSDGFSIVNTPANISTEGSTKLTVTTTDWAANEIISTYTINIDKTKPTISGITENITDKTITGTAQDTLSGIIAYQYSTDDELTAQSPGWTTIEPTTESYTAPAYTITANNTYYFYVKDQAGNVNAEVIEIEENTPIIITIGEPNREYIKGKETAEYVITTSEDVTIADESKVTVTGAGGAGCTVALTGSGKSWTATVTGKTTAEIEIEGAVILTLEAGLFKDAAGNVVTTEATRDGLIMDNKAPVVTINPPNSDGETVSSIELKITVSDGGSGLADNNSYFYWLAQSMYDVGAKRNKYENEMSFTIGNGLTGTYTLYIDPLYDKAGNKIALPSGWIVYELGGPYIFD